MASRRRGTYSGDYGRGRSGSVLRSVILMILLGLACFFLGFFVIARVLPGSLPGSSSQKQEISTLATNGLSPADRAERSDVRRENRTSSAPPALAPALAPSLSPANASQPTPITGGQGPVIEPEGDNRAVQAPDNALPAENGTGRRVRRRHRYEPDTTSQDNGDGEAIAPPPDNTQPTIVDPNAPPTDAPATDAPLPKHRNRRRRRTNPADQAPTDLNGGETTNGDDMAAMRSKTADDVNDTSQNVQAPGSPETSATAPTRASSGYYHVQTGLFSTQEAADANARQLQDKNMSATVQKVQRDGRTLYRVQHAVYRSRAHAEAARKRLSDAGIDATITGP